jgi:hypothetical protein
MTAQEIIDKGRWTRMRIIFGESVMPPEDAEITVRAVNRAMALGDITGKSRWKIIPLWAAAYMAEEKASMADMRGEVIHEITVTPFSAICSCGEWEYHGNEAVAWAHFHLAESKLGRKVITEHVKENDVSRNPHG